MVEPFREVRSHAPFPTGRCAEVDTTWLRSDAWLGSPSYRLPYAWSVRARWSSTCTRVNAELVAMSAILKKNTHQSYVACRITVDVQLYSRSTHTYGRSDLLWPPVYSEYTQYTQYRRAFVITARGCGYFYSGPKSTRKYLYSLFWNHIVGKTRSLHVLTPCIQKPENERLVPDRATRVAMVARSGTARSFCGF